jgi:hypothetical protein
MEQIFPNIFSPTPIKNLIIFHKSGVIICKDALSGNRQGIFS